MILGFNKSNELVIFGLLIKEVDDVKRTWLVHPIFLVIFLFIFFLSHSTSFCAQDLSTLFEKMSPGVVTVYSSNQGKKEVSQGSGFFINSQGWVITNHHVVDGFSQIVIITSDNKEYRANQVLKIDKDKDLALLATTVPGEKIFPLPVNPNLPRIGEPIVVIGSPDGYRLSLSDGLVSAIRDLPKYTISRFIQFTAPISGGSSGSPLINYQGEVIGVVKMTAIGEQVQNINFTTPMTSP